jgi:hypothetical protein
MFFYTNPYNDASLSEGKPQNDIKIPMKCEVFDWFDPEDADEGLHSVIHFFMDSDSIEYSTSNVELEDIQG